MTFSEPQVPPSSDDPEMSRILHKMLDSDETITARAVARRHSSLKHASSITRNSTRSGLLSRYQLQQNQYRAWRGRTPKRSREQLDRQLAQMVSRITELEGQVEALQVSHLAMMRTVGQMGGMGKLLGLYEGYRDLRGELDRLGVLPRGELKPFELGSHGANE